MLQSCLFHISEILLPNFYSCLYHKCTASVLKERQLDNVTNYNGRGIYSENGCSESFIDAISENDLFSDNFLPHNGVDICPYIAETSGPIIRCFVVIYHEIIVIIIMVRTKKVTKLMCQQSIFPVKMEYIYIYIYICFDL